MATMETTQKLGDDLKVVILSPLPTLNVSDSFHTKHPSNSPFVLSEERVKKWRNFVQEVKNTIAEVMSPLPENFEAIFQRMFHAVGNETGSQASFIAFVSEIISQAMKECGIPVAMGDYQSGISMGSNPGDAVPDLIILGEGDRLIRVVGEVKAHWAFSPKRGQTQAQFLAEKFGQVARYMDDHHSKYGFFTTYKQTWLIKRTGATTFLASEAVEADAASSGEIPSLRECMVFLAMKASSDDCRYEGRVGRTLTNKRYNQMKSTVRPLRIFKRQAYNKNNNKKR